MFDVQTPVNDVWGTIADVLNRKESEKTRRQEIAAAVSISQSRAAPSGFLESWGFRNPLPGMFSPYPQSDTKPVTGTVAGSGMGNIVMLAVLGVLAFVLLKALAK